MCRKVLAIFVIVLWLLVSLPFGVIHAIGMGLAGSDERCIDATNWVFGVVDFLWSNIAGAMPLNR